MMSRAEIDRLIDDHFRYEATDDVDGVVASLAPDAAHHVIPSPVGPIRGSEATRAFYQRLFAALAGRGVTPVRRLYGDDFVIDEVIWHGDVTDGSIFLCDGQSGPVSFRMLHVFEFDGGLIKSEQVWCDLAAIQAQLEESAPVAAAPSQRVA
jgi:ketosteroid isomerase-like protein